MSRELEQSDLLIKQIDGENYLYIRPDIGEFDSQRKISDRVIVGDGRFSLGTGSVTVEDHTAINTKIGIRLNSDVDAHVYNYQFLGTQSPNAYAAGVYRSKGHEGSAEFLRVFGDGEVNPPATSKVRLANIDFLDNNSWSVPDGDALYFRDLTIRNFGDAAIDAKSSVFIMNATIDNTFNALRAQGDSTIIIVNSIVNSSDNGNLIKLTGDNSRVLYYNTKWDGKDNPDPDKIGTWKVPFNQKNSVISKNVIELDSNPLPKLDDFFAIDNAKYFAQVSVNGRGWIDLDLPNKGFLSTHVGDTLIKLPNLGAGEYRVRAWTVEDGESSDVVTSGSFDVSRQGVTAPRSESVSVDSSSAQRDAGAPPPPSRGLDIIENGTPRPGGGEVLVGGRGDQVVITTSGDDRISTGWGHDVILFDTRADIGDDVIVDFNRSRDMLAFTKFVDLGADEVHRIDSLGRFNLDDPELDAEGGTIALGQNLADRWMHYAGETEEGLFLYEVWARPWNEIG